LVTGASGGIGSALVNRLLAADVTVIGVSRHPTNSTTATEGRLVSLGQDMADSDALPEFAARVQRDHGPVDILVPNAGHAVVQTLEAVTLSDWQQAMAVNTTAPFLLAQALAPSMADRGWGRILFTSSVAAFTGGFVGPH